MSVSNTTVKAVYSGAIGQDTFAIPFEYEDASQVKVYLLSNKYTFTIAIGNATAGAVYTNNGLNFTVQTTVTGSLSVVLASIGTPLSSGTLTKTAGAGDATLTFSAVSLPTIENNLESFTIPVPFANVVLDNVLQGNTTVTVIRESAITQPDVFSVGAFPAVAITNRFDKITEMIQEAFEKISRCISSPLSSVANYVFPSPLANALLGWNSTASALENKSIIDISSIQTNITNLQNDVIALDGRLDTAESDIDDLETNYAGLDARVITAENNVTTFDLRLNTAEADILNLQNAVALLGDQTANIVDLQNRMDDAETDVLDLVSQDSTHTTDIGTLVSRVSTLETIAYQLSRRKVGFMEILNNNAVPTDVIGENNGSILNLNSNGAYSGEVFIEIRRKTDDKTIFTNGRLILQCINAVWNIVRDTTTTINGVLADDNTADGVYFTIDTVGVVGTVKYTTDDMSGANYEGTLRWMLQEISNTF